MKTAWLRTLTTLLAFALAACPAPRPTTPDKHAASSTEVAVAAAPAGRLSDAAVPRAYRLSLDLTPARLRVSGVMEIDLTLTQAAASVWLHGVDLEIEYATLRHNKKELTLTQLPAPAARGLLGFAFGRTLAAGNAILRIEFSTTLRGDDGIFRQRYQDQWYAYTDFEPIDARRGFPCFDDPRFKTPWTISLRVPQDLKAFSNTPVEHQSTPKEGRKTVRFMTSPALPTYLVAFAVGPFEIVEDTSEAAKDATPIRVLTFPGHRRRAFRALYAAQSLLPLAASWVAMPVPFRKLDFIAVPRFNGAMENPGLITVSSRILHVDADAPTPAKERLMTLVVAHEIAHLWFGDLVTMRWWDDLWLNEGFATYLADELIETWKPSWGWHLEREAMRSRAYEADARADVRAVRQRVRTDQEIRERFDVSTYIKGAGILEMLDHWLGRKAFQAGVRAYLRNHAGKSVTTEDLLRELEQAAGRPVRLVLEGFLDQKGAPFLDKASNCGARDRYRLMKHRVVVPLAGEKPAKGREWWVPACQDVGYRLRPFWSPATDRQALQSIQWARANLRSDDRQRNAAGRKMLTLIARRAQHGSAAERLVVALTELENVLPQPLTLETELRATVQAIGWRSKPRERIDDREARPELIMLAARHLPVPNAVQTRAGQWLKDRTGLDPELITATLAALATHGDAALHSRYLTELLGEKDPEYRDAIVAGLASFGEPTLLAASLAMTVERSFPRADAIKLLYRALQNPHTRRQAYTFLHSNAAALGALYRTSPFMSRFACSRSEQTIANSLIVGMHTAAPKQKRLLEQLRSEYQTCKRLRDHYKRAAEAR